ncbi:MAG: molybdopterin molybdotransferase MoeA [Fimbriimonas sp.]|nr:molybdopterin molybdotransferase MoeA [Fimbriimonas sp.]
MFSDLLSYDEAVASIRSHVNCLNRRANRPVSESLGLAIAADLFSPTDNPLFDNSAVDGYAVSSDSDAVEGRVLVIEGSNAAGESAGNLIAPGTARRILTGAPTPTNTYGIVMQENTEVTGGAIRLLASTSVGAHIRRRGSDFRTGDCLLPVGSVIGPGQAAVLAFAGCTVANVFLPPKVSVVTTGDELVDPSEEPSGPMIRDTNSVMLSAQVKAATARSPRVRRVSDRMDMFCQVLAKEAGVSDVILVAGGASVGDRDLLETAMKQMGIVIFHGVSMRPGKPFLFGKLGNALVFGLPGNPASAFVCFEIFVRAALRSLGGWRSPEINWIHLPAGFVHPAVGREDFVRVVYNSGKLQVTREQGSFGLASLATAHALARFPAEQSTVNGQLCPVLIL